MNFIAMLIHQFEEFRFPGGLRPAENILVRKNGIPARYRMNQLSNMLGNMTFIYVVFLLPLIFPDIVWLAIAPTIYLTIGQMITHGIVLNRKSKTFYNPGMAATFLLHAPIACFYTYYIIYNDMVSVLSWGVAAIYFAFGVLRPFY